VDIPKIFLAIYKEEGKDENSFSSIDKRNNLKNLNKESIATFESLYCC
jgi:hypothetical protein